MYLLFKNAKLLILKRRLNDKNHIEIILRQKKSPAIARRTYLYF